MDEERALEGIEHLQAAARELIAAARAMLDVAENLVNDPGTAATVVAAFGSIAKAAVRAGAPGGGESGQPGGDRVERIRVS